MDPKDNPTNPTPFNGGQASTASQPPVQPALAEEVNVDLNQQDDAQVGGQQAVPPMDAFAGQQPSASAQPQQGSTAYDTSGANPAVPDPSLGTINPSSASVPQDPLAYNSSSFGQPAPAPGAPASYDGAATQPQQPGVAPVQASQDPYAAPQQSSEQPSQNQPQPGMQTPEQQGVPHTMPSLLGADRKTIIILAAVAAVLIIAIAVLIFM